jgi:Zn ribbon nucleic-acid-binding protein
MSKKYVSPNRGKNCRKVYHTNPECQTVETIRPASDHEIEHQELALCAYCDPEKTPTKTEQSRDHYKALKKAAQKND